jgi:hypothetical protein
MMFLRTESEKHIKTENLDYSTFSVLLRHDGIRLDGRRLFIPQIRKHDHA